jgi:hypothetical protein
VALTAPVFPPFSDRRIPVRFDVRDVPRGWGVLLEPQEMVLPPGGRDAVRFMVFPSGLGRGQKPDDRYQPGFIGKPKLEAQIPYADTYVPIGGIDVWTHLVRKTRLDCQLLGAGEDYRPPEDRTEREGAPGPANEQERAMPGVVVKRGRVSMPTQRAVVDPQRLLAASAVVKRPVRLPRVTLGDEVTAAGQLTPAVQGAVIAVEFRSARGSKVQLVKTSRTGVYRAVYRPDAAGRWLAQAFFSGDMTLGAAESRLCSFVVKQ